jgi:hypothetical protein
MEWTIEYNNFMGSEFFVISTPVENGKHTIMVEYKEGRAHSGWIVRDACDSGEVRSSMLRAIMSYIDRSKVANRSKVGHCGWMIDVGLPALETAKFELVSTMCSTYLTKHAKAVN